MNQTGTHNGGTGFHPPATMRDWHEPPAPGEYFERWRVDKVAEVTGLGTSTIWRDAGRGTFPPPIKDGAVTYWISTQVIAWNHERLLAALKRSN